jgi:phage/plasmid-associated DNA primase
MRRWLILTFNHKLPVEQKKDRYHETMLTEEREAICAWIMEAAPKFKESSLPTFPKSHQQAASEMFNLHNSVRMFLFESGIVKSEKGKQIEESKLHDRYWSYCVQTGLGKPLSQRLFRSKARQFEMDFGFHIEMVKDEKTGQDEAIFQGLDFNR